MRINRKNGSSIVMLAMVFVSLAMAICGAIVIARTLVVKSECKVFSKLWAESILSEYDVHLLEDYGIMAYFGNEIEVKKKLDTYIKYSSSNKLDAVIGRSSAELVGMELGNISNFKKALNKSGINNLGTSFERNSRNKDAAAKEYKDRSIANKLVIDTLPSSGITNTLNNDSIVKKIKNGKYSSGFKKTVNNTGVEFLLIQSCFNSHLKTASTKKSFLRNEWEYIVSGKKSDAANFNACKRSISLVRNGLNLYHIYNDKEKMEIITAISGLICPEGLIATQAIIAEAWALLETESDMEVLLNNGQVPFIKKKSDWRTSLSNVISKDSFKKKLDDESRKLLEENKADINTLSGRSYSGGNSNNGRTYEDYLLLLMLSLNKNTRMLRCMDIIQLNMKYRYYRDFNMMEYYIGVGFSIKANRISYETKEIYK